MTRPPRAPLRPARFDDLGLRRALSDRLLPLLVGAMAFLAALALSGAVAASALARHWQGGAAALLTVQVPDPDGAAADTPAGGAPATRAAHALGVLQRTPGVAHVRLVPDEELAGLLRPWLGSGSGRIALVLPAVLEVQLAGTAGDVPDGIAAALSKVAPGALVEPHDIWIDRLAVLARSLQACAAIALGVVGFVAAAVIAIATRAGLAARRDAIEIVHGLGATRGYIAGRFARRATLLTTAGAAAGAVAAIPVLVGLAILAAPFVNQDQPAAGLPPVLWLALPALPLAAACIGWVTAQATVRRWLRRLP